MWVQSPVTTNNFSILYFVTVLIRGTIIKFRGHRGFNPKSSSPESPVCTTAVHSHKTPREMVVYKSVWTQRHKKDQRSEISTTGLRSRRSEAPRAFAGSELSECHFLVANDTKQVVLTSQLSAKNFCLTILLFLGLSSQPFSDPFSSRCSFIIWWIFSFLIYGSMFRFDMSEALELFGFFPRNKLIE